MKPPILQVPFRGDSQYFAAEYSVRAPDYGARVFQYLAVRLHVVLAEDLPHSKELYRFFRHDPGVLYGVRLLHTDIPYPFRILDRRADYVFHRYSALFDSYNSCVADLQRLFDYEAFALKPSSNLKDKKKGLHCKASFF